MSTNLDISSVREFLATDSTETWIEAALVSIDTLLSDQANCEKKAAGTALSLLYRYIDRNDLLLACSKLAREELRHFELVMGLMKKLGVVYQYVPASRYAGALFSQVANHEPDRLVDTLVVAGIIEARSCERFWQLSKRLTNSDSSLGEHLGRFYGNLVESESRHFKVYLDLAELYGEGDVAGRVSELITIEQKLILESDEGLRFHSGTPQ